MFMRYRKRNSDKILGQILIDRKKIDASQMSMALQIRKYSKKEVLLGEVLLDLRLVSEDDILEAAIEQYQFPYLPVNQYEIDAQVLVLVPIEVAAKYTLIPLQRTKNNLTVVMANPADEKAIKEVELVSKCQVSVFIDKASEIRQAISTYYKSEDPQFFTGLSHPN
jgi:type IV pilus assembly protein PilB